MDGDGWSAHDRALARIAELEADKDLEVHVVFTTPDGQEQIGTLKRISKSEVQRIGEMLQAVRDKASPRDRWVYRLYSGLVAERALLEATQVQLEHAEHDYTEALSHVLGRLWALQELILQIGNAALIQTDEDAAIFQTCRQEVIDRQAAALQPEQVH